MIRKKYNRRRAARAALLAMAVIAYLLPPASAQYGQDRCTGTWRYTPVDPASPCLTFTNGITGTDVLNGSNDANDVQTCSQTEEYAILEGLDESAIRTLVTVFDWVSGRMSQSWEDTRAGNAGVAGLSVLSIGLTNLGVTTSTLASISWKSIETRKKSRILEFTNPKWGKTLVLRYVCSSPPCYQVTVHQIACYAEELIDNSIFPAAGTKLLSDNFSINCDPQHAGLLQAQTCINTWSATALPGEDDAFVFLSSVAGREEENVVSIHIIPGFCYGTGCAGFTQGIPTEVYLIYTDQRIEGQQGFVTWNSVTDPNNKQMRSYSDESWSTSILDFDLGGTKNVETLMIEAYSSTPPLFAGYFLLKQPDDMPCSSLSTCDSDCIRVSGIEIDDPVVMPFLAGSSTVLTITFESPSQCGAYLQIFQPVAPTHVDIALGATTVTEVSFIVTLYDHDTPSEASYEVTENWTYNWLGQDATLAMPMTFSYTNECESVTWTGTVTPEVTVTHDILNVEVVTTDLTPFGTLSSPTCQPYVEYFVESTTGDARLQTFEVDATSGQLTTAIVSTVTESATITEVVRVGVKYGDTVFDYREVTVTVNLVNPCEDTSFVDSSETTIAVTHDLADPQVVETDLTEFAALSNGSCQQYVAYEPINGSPGSNLSTFSADSPAGTLRTEVAASVTAAVQFAETIQAVLRFNGSLAEVKYYTISVTIAADCAQTTFASTGNENVPVTHDLADPQSITTDLTGYGVLVETSCQQYVTYAPARPSGFDGNLQTFSVDDTGQLVTEIKTSVTEPVSVTERVIISLVVGGVEIVTKTLFMNVSGILDCSSTTFVKPTYDNVYVNHDLADLQAITTDLSGGGELVKTSCQQYVTYEPTKGPSDLNEKLETFSVDSSGQLVTEIKTSVTEPDFFEETILAKLVVDGVEIVSKTFFIKLNLVLDCSLATFVLSSPSVTVEHSVITKPILEVPLASYGEVTIAACQSTVTYAITSLAPSYQYFRIEDSSAGVFKSQLISSVTSEYTSTGTASATLPATGATLSIDLVMDAVFDGCAGEQFVDPADSSVTITHYYPTIVTVSTALSAYAETSADCQQYVTYSREDTSDTASRWTLGFTSSTGFMTSEIKVISLTTDSSKITATIVIDGQSYATKEITVQLEQEFECASATFTAPDADLTIQHDLLDLERIETDLSSYGALTDSDCHGYVQYSIPSPTGNSFWQELSIGSTSGLLTTEITSTATATTINEDVQIQVFDGDTGMWYATRTVTVIVDLLNACSGATFSNSGTYGHTIDIGQHHKAPFTYDLSPYATTSDTDCQQYVRYTLISAPGFFQTAAPFVDSETGVLTMQLNDPGSGHASPAGITLQASLLGTTEMKPYEISVNVRDCSIAEFVISGDIISDQVTIEHDLLNKEAVTTNLSSFGELVEADSICQSLVVYDYDSDNGTVDDLETISIDQASGLLTTEIVASQMTPFSLPNSEIVEISVMNEDDVLQQRQVQLSFEGTNACAEVLFQDSGDSQVEVTHDLLNKEAVTTDLTPFGTLMDPACQEYVVYSADGTDARVKTFTVDPAGSVLTEVADSLNSSVEIEFYISLTVVISEVNYSTKSILLTVSGENECETTEFTFIDLHSLVAEAGLTELLIKQVSSMTSDSVSESKLNDDDEAGTYEFCQSGRVYTLVDGYDNTLLAEPIVSSDGQLTMQLLPSVDSKQSTRVNVRVSMQFSDGTTVTEYASKEKIFTVYINACEMDTRTVSLPDDITVQVRQNPHSIPVPEWSYNEDCNGGVKDVTWEFIDVDNGTVLALPPTGVSLVDEINFDTAKDDILGVTSFIIRYSQTNFRTESPDRLVTNSDEILVQYVDNCGVEAESSISPFTVVDIETSVLRAVDDPLVPEQTIANDASPTLMVEYEDFWNKDICGDIQVSLVSMDLVILDQDLIEEFISIGYTYDSVEADRWIKVRPTLNSHINQDGHQVGLMIQLVEYENISVTVPLVVTVLPCRVTSLPVDEGYEYVDPYEYIIVTQKEFINVSNFRYEPACIYDYSYSLEVAPVVSPPIVQQTDEDELMLTVHSTKLSLAGEYNVIITILPAGYIYSDQVDVDLMIRVFTLSAIDPCLVAILEPTITTIHLHAIIGNDERFHEFDDYPDDVSAFYDQEGSQSGYQLCGNRQHSIQEASDDVYEPGTTLVTELPYMSLYGSQDYVLFVTYGSDDVNHAGSHLVQLDVSLVAYPSIFDSTGHLNFTFFDLVTDLEVSDAVYTLTFEELEIDVPEIIFEPPLHSSYNAETGVDGGQLIYTVHKKVGEEEYVPLPEELGQFDEAARKLYIVSNEPEMVGDHTIMLNFAGQDYLEGQLLQTEFKLTILPKPVEPSSFLSLFELDGVTLTHQVNVGEAWSFEIPPFEGDDLAQTVMLGKASSFVTYDEGDNELSIATGATTETNTGTSSILVQLKNSEGAQVDEITIKINVIGLQEAEGSVTEEETVEGIVTVDTTDLSVDTDIGLFYHELLVARKNNQNFIDFDENNKPKPLKTVIRSVSQTGKISIEFSNPMIVFEPLTTMTNEGFLVTNNEKQDSRMLDETSVAEDEEDQLKEKEHRIDLGIIDIKVSTGGFIDEKDLSFQWQVNEYTSNKMEIQVSFDQPLMISSSPEKEEVSITFLSEDFFVDQYGQNLSSNTLVTKVLPQQLESEAQLAQLEQAQISLQTSTSGIFAANFLLNILFSASLQYLWDLINAQQIVILLPLFNVQTPGNVRTVFNALMTIAAFDAIPTEDLYEEYFYDGEAFPINENFERSGFEHHLLLNNFGSLGIVCVGYFFLIIGNYIASRCCYRVKCCRKRTRALTASLYWNIPMRVIMESYTIGFICCLLNMRILDFSRDDKWVYSNTILTLVILPVLVFFPILAGRFMYRNFHDLEDNKAIQVKYGELYEGWNMRSKWILFYWEVDYLRKALLAVVITVTQTTFAAQMTSLIITSVVLLVISLQTWTRETRFGTWMDNFNEIKLLLLMYHIMLFTMMVPDPTLKQQIGISATIFLVGGTAINMGILFIAPVKLLKRKYKIRKAKRYAKRELQVRRPNAKKFAERRKLFLSRWAILLQARQRRIDGEIEAGARSIGYLENNFESKKRRFIRRAIGLASQIPRPGEEGYESSSNESSDESSDESSQGSPQDSPQRSPSRLPQLKASNVQEKKVHIPRDKIVKTEEPETDMIYSGSESQRPKKVARKEPETQLIYTGSESQRHHHDQSEITRADHSYYDAPSMMNVTDVEVTRIDQGSPVRVRETDIPQSDQQPPFPQENRQKPFIKSKLVSWQELDNLIMNKGMSLEEIERLPGYENFIVSSDDMPVFPAVVFAGQEPPRDRPFVMCDMQQPPDQQLIFDDNPHHMDPRQRNSHQRQGRIPSIPIKNVHVQYPPEYRQRQSHHQHHLSQIGQPPQQVAAPAYHDPSYQHPGYKQPLASNQMSHQYASAPQQQHYPAAQWQQPHYQQHQPTYHHHQPQPAAQYHHYPQQQQHVQYQHHQQPHVHYHHEQPAPYHQHHQLPVQQQHHFQQQAPAYHQQPPPVQHGHQPQHHRHRTYDEGQHHHHADHHRNHRQPSDPRHQQAQAHHREARPQEEPLRVPPCKEAPRKARFRTMTTNDQQQPEEGNNKSVGQAEASHFKSQLKNAPMFKRSQVVPAARSTNLDWVDDFLASDDMQVEQSHGYGHPPRSNDREPHHHHHSSHQGQSAASRSSSDYNRHIYQ